MIGHLHRNKSGLKVNTGLKKSREMDIYLLNELYFRTSMSKKFIPQLKMISNNDVAFLRFLFWCENDIGISGGSSRI